MTADRMTGTGSPRLMTIIVGVLAVLGLSGCGVAHNVDANVTGYSEQCIKGVMYLDVGTGVTPELKPDGTVQTCTDTNTAH